MVFPGGSTRLVMNSKEAPRHVWFVSLGWTCDTPLTPSADGGIPLLPPPPPSPPSWSLSYSMFLMHCQYFASHSQITVFLSPLVVGNVTGS